MKTHHHHQHVREVCFENDFNMSHSNLEKIGCFCIQFNLCSLLLPRRFQLVVRYSFDPYKCSLLKVIHQCFSIVVDRASFASMLDSCSLFLHCSRLATRTH